MKIIFADITITLTPYIAIISMQGYVMSSMAYVLHLLNYVPHVATAVELSRTVTILVKDVYQYLFVPKPQPNAPTVIEIQRYEDNSYIYILYVNIYDTNTGRPATMFITIYPKPPKITHLAQRAICSPYKDEGESNEGKGKGRSSFGPNIVIGVGVVLTVFGFLYKVVSNSGDKREHLYK